jgi:RIO-like serine/threonine protein kinase
VISEEARRRGISTPEVLVARVERVWGPLYRGWLVTRELPAAQDLWAALQSNDYQRKDRELLLKTVARSISQMHLRGIFHQDLNLKNILVEREAAEIRSAIIDFDRATLFPGAVPPGKAERNLNRLLRSVRKLDPERKFLTQDDWDLLMHFYREFRK